jgi:hypothetical protein
MFTDAVIAALPGMVARGMTLDQMADEIGCTVSTLRVRCSQLKISLQGMSGRRGPIQPNTCRVSFRITHETMRALRKRADAMKLNADKLAAIVLEIVAADDLWAAVLDNEPAKLVA